jgi:hypothetical protein
MTDADLAGQYIQVVVEIDGASGSQVLSIDPWDNCPFEMAREEGRYCNECEFWGQEVRGIDWAEFSACYFSDGSC